MKILAINKIELNGKIFQPLKDNNYFKTFSIKFNTIEWDNGADFAPEYLYQIGVMTKKPRSHNVYNP